MCDMNSNPILEENIKFVLARLRLAQALLEESDALPGYEGYNFKNENEWWLHPRHEREALVVYLLLTCFDRLGQERGFTTFKDWLKSKNSDHEHERQEVLQTLSSTTPPLEVATALADQYQALYGVRNAFYRGIENLSDELQKKLLSSITVVINPEFGKYGPDTSTPSFPLNDDVLERKLKLKYLYERRNRFTHRLEQYYAASTPFAWGPIGTDGVSWNAIIEDSLVKYMYPPNQGIEPFSKGAYVYSTRWPFDLFEVLHAAVGSEFHRTDIKLRFLVTFINLSTSRITRKVVNHCELKDIRILESQFLKQTA